VLSKEPPLKSTNVESLKKLEKNINILSKNDKIIAETLNNHRKNFEVIASSTNEQKKILDKISKKLLK